MDLNQSGEATKKNPIRRARTSPCFPSHACMRLRPGTVRTVRLVQRRRIQRKIPVRGKEKAAAGARARSPRRGQTPLPSRARTPVEAKEEASSADLSRSDMSSHATPCMPVRRPARAHPRPSSNPRPQLIGHKATRAAAAA